MADRAREADLVVALGTAPDAETAERIARSLVEERLVACVNLVHGVRSIYRWQGRVESEAEVLMVIKTRRARIEPLKRRLVELHPYEVPELIAVGVEDGLDAYCRWVAEESTDPRE